MITDGNSNGVVGMGFQLEVIPELRFITYKLFLPLKFPGVWSSILCITVAFCSFQDILFAYYAVLPIPLCFIYYLPRYTVVTVVKLSHSPHLLLGWPHQTWSQIILLFNLKLPFSCRFLFLQCVFSAHNEVSNTSTKGTPAKGVTSYWNDNLWDKLKQSKNVFWL